MADFKRVLKDSARGSLKEGFDLEALSYQLDENRKDVKGLLKDQLSLESQDEGKLQDLAIRMAEGQLGKNADEETLGNTARTFYEDISKNRDKYLEAHKKAAAEPGVLGIPEPQTVLPTYDQQEAIRNQKLYQQTRRQADEQVLKRRPELGKDYLLNKPLPPDAELEAKRLQEIKRFGAERPNEDFVDKFVNAMSRSGEWAGAGVGGAIDHLVEKGAAGEPGERNVLGLDAGKALDVLKGEFDWKGALKGHVLGTLAGGPFLGPMAGLAAAAFGGEPEVRDAAMANANKADDAGPSLNEHSLNYTIQKRKDAYRAKAMDQAAQEGQGQERVDELYKTYIDKDLLGVAVENPNAAAEITKTLVDPANFLPVGEVLGGIKRLVGGVAKATRAGRGIANAAQAVKEGFSFVPEATRLPEKLKTTGNMMELAAEQADVAVHKGVDSMTDLLKPLQSLNKSERELLAVALQNPHYAGLLPSKLQKPFKAAQQLSEKHWDFLTEHGLTQKFNSTGHLAKVTKRADYDFPHRIVDDAGEGPFHFADEGGGPDLKSLDPNSTKERTSNRKDWLMDPVAQWEKEILSTKKQALASSELRRIMPMLEEQGSVARLPRGGDSKTVLAELSKRDGVDWVELDPRLQQRVDKAIGTPGQTKLGGDVMIAPAPVAARAAEILKAGVAPKEINRVLGDANKSIFRPIMNIARTANVLLTPAFYVTSAIGNLGQMFLADGVKALRPDRLAVGLGAAIANMFNKPQAGRGIRLFGKGGPDLERLMKTAIEDGQMGQGAWRLGYDMESGGKSGTVADMIGKPFQKLEKGLSTVATPGKKASQAIDDFMRFTVWLNALDPKAPLSAASRANAAKLVEERVGNYRRLGRWDNKIKDSMLYYSFMRTTSAAFMKHVAQRPGRVATLARTRNYQNDEAGQDVPFGDAAIPAQYQGSATRAALEDQPRETRKKLESGEPLDAFRDKLAVQQREDGISAGTNLVGLIEGLTGTSDKRVPDTILDMLGPIEKTIVKIARGTSIADVVKGLPKDVIGRPMREMPALWQFLKEKYSLPEELRDESIEYLVGNAYFVGPHKAAPGTRNKLTGSAMKNAADDQTTAIQKARSKIK